MSDYTETTAAIARAARVTQQTVQGYAAKGQLHHIQASNGVRLFRPEAAAQVRKILKANLKRRGSFGRGISRS